MDGLLARTTTITNKQDETAIDKQHPTSEQLKRSATRADQARSVPNRTARSGSNELKTRLSGS